MHELFMKHVLLETQQKSPMKEEIKSEANHQSVGFHVRFLGDWLMIFGGGRVHGWLGILGGHEFHDLGFVWQEVGLFYCCFGDVLFGMTKNLAASHTVARFPQEWSHLKILSRIGALKRCEVSNVVILQLTFHSTFRPLKQKSHRDSKFQHNKTNKWDVISDLYIKWSMFFFGQLVLEVRACM